MAKIIKPRERKTHTEFELCFRDIVTNEPFYGFPLIKGQIIPCKQGKDPNTYEPCSKEECPWWENYLKAQSDENLYCEIEKHTWSWHEPAVAICECGKEIRLNNDAEACEYCGRLHNLFGQELLPRKFWGREYEMDN